MRFGVKTVRAYQVTRKVFPFTRVYGVNRFIINIIMLISCSSNGVNSFKHIYVSLDQP